MIHELTGEDFVVDKDVCGRLSGDLSDVTYGGIESSLREAGIFVGNGRIRRVSTSEDPATFFELTSEYAGAPMNFSFSHAPVRELLCRFTKFGLRLIVAPDVEGEISIFADGVPWDAAFEGIVAAGGWSWRLDSGRLLVERGGQEPSDSLGAAPGELCSGGEKTSGGGAEAVQLKATALEDLVLVAVTRGDEGWNAWARGPEKRIVMLEPGYVVGDAEVIAIDRNGVRLTRADSSVVDLQLSSL